MHFLQSSYCGVKSVKLYWKLLFFKGRVTQWQVHILNGHGSRVWARLKPRASTSSRSPTWAQESFHLAHCLLLFPEQHHRPGLEVEQLPLETTFTWDDSVASSALTLYAIMHVQVKNFHMNDFFSIPKLYLYKQIHTTVICLAQNFTVLNVFHMLKFFHQIRSWKCK